MLYVLWNVYSALTPHKYPPGDQLTLEPYSLRNFILIPTVIPFVLYATGRLTFDRAAAVRALLWTILAFAAYSAAVSILPFTGPTQLVWPRYIMDARPGRDAPWVSSISRSSTEWCSRSASPSRCC